MAQYGFYFDQTQCIGCHTCQISCKYKNRLEIGELYRNVHSYETGEYPTPGIFHLADTCHHCTDAPCVKVCPTGRTVKDPETGIVFHAPDVNCLGEKCQACAKVCPYHHPAFRTELNVMGKCDMCRDLIANGEQPACVAACMTRALQFGPVEELKKKFGPDLVTEEPCLPADKTGSNFYIKPRACAMDANFEEQNL